MFQQAQKQRLYATQAAVERREFYPTVSDEARLWRYYQR